MTDNNCIFCKIAAGEIPSATLFEDEKFRVILDVGPAAKGHMLILPKDHYADICEMPEDLVGEAFKLAKKMAEKQQRVLGCDGINVLQNNHEAAGQTVFHFHIHLIPRFKKDKINIGWKPGELSEADRDELLTSFQES
ncbi:MAG: HIT family protein [Eubacteriales bacterium]|nr:HIT family protein [Eubacteriales bacterium]